ncbi:hypothetical protein RJ55_06742 [Drechmeria coniospora]|nr:hypothetical protein RJ55_06742 [Drechmeria coniospora]
MAAKQANSDATTWSALDIEGQVIPPHIHEDNVDDFSCGPIRGYIDWEGLISANDAFESWDIPADSGIDDVGSNEIAVATTTHSLSAEVERKISDLCGGEHSGIRKQLADMSSRLSAIEAQLANADHVHQVRNSTKDRQRGGGRPRKACPKSGAAGTVHSIRLTRIWLRENEADTGHEYTWKGTREYGKGLWRSETIGADTTLEGVHFALMTDILFLEVRINGGSHFPITMQWNAEAEVFEGQDMLRKTNLLIGYYDMLEMLCNPHQACREWQVCQV